MSESIGVALVGFGLGGRYFHAPLISSTRGLALRAVVTSDAERQRAVLSEYPGARVAESLDALLTHDRDIDLVVISTPNRTHRELALAAIDAGQAVVVDKPITPTSGEARELIAAARTRGVLLTVYQNRRWDGDFLTIRRLLRERRLGDVYRFESRFDRWRPTPKPGWREHGDPAEAGGLLYDLGSHLIDQALTLFGPVAEVYSELDRRRSGVQVDDDMFVALTHESGVRSHLWATVVAAQSGPRFRVLGSKATYTKYGMDVQEEALKRGERPGPNWGAEPKEHWGRLGTDADSEVVSTERGSFGDFYQGVARAMRDGAPPPVDPSDAVATLEVIERALGKR